MTGRDTSDRSPERSDSTRRTSARRTRSRAASTRARSCAASGTTFLPASVGVEARLHRAGDQVEHLRRQVVALSPQSTLERGYAVVQHRDGRIVMDQDDVGVGELLRVRVARGDFGVRPVTAGAEDPTPSTATRRTAARKTTSGTVTKAASPRTSRATGRAGVPKPASGDEDATS